MLERKLIEVHLPSHMLQDDSATSTSSSSLLTNDYAPCTTRHLYPLLPLSLVSLPAYLTYAHLRNSTYVVLRHGSKDHAGRNRARDGKSKDIKDDEG